MWGLEVAESFISKHVPRIFKSKKENVENKTRDAVKTHLREVRANVDTEIELVADATLSKRERGKRLLFLFQRDLLPGVSGKILETKANRDTETQKEVTLTTKVCGWSYVVILNSSMLFYIFLFALQQTSVRQQAWLQSFLMWLVMQIFLIAPTVVYITHVLIPSFTFKELKKIKNYLIQSFKNHRKRQKRRTEAQSTAEENQDAFNTAEYLFVSYRIAKFYPDLLESKVILNFATQWPVQTYNRQKDISKEYKGSFKAIQSGISTLIVFLITNSIDLPPSLQDMIMDMVSTVSIGYTILIHIQLYQLFPVLVIIPTLVIGVLIHFFVKANRIKANQDGDILPLLNDDDDDMDPFETLKAVENIDTLQDLLVERDKRDRRQRLQYQWADSTDGDSKVCEDRPQSAPPKSRPSSALAENKCDMKTQISHDSKHSDPFEPQQNDFLEAGGIDQPLGDATQRERGNSMKSEGSGRSALSIKDEDLPASSRGSSWFPSPKGSICEGDSPVSSLVDSKSSISMSWYQESTSSIESGKMNRWKSPAPWDRLQAMLNERASNAVASPLLTGDDNYSLPSKESVKSDAELSYAQSQCTQVSSPLDSKTSFSVNGDADGHLFKHNNIEWKRWRSPSRFLGKKIRTAREIMKSSVNSSRQRCNDDLPESKDSGDLDGQLSYNLDAMSNRKDDANTKLPSGSAIPDDSEVNQSQHTRDNSCGTQKPAGSTYLSFRSNSEQNFECKNPMQNRARSFSGFSSLSALTGGSAAEDSPYFRAGIKNNMSGDDSSPNPSIYEPTSSRESEIESVQSLQMKELELLFSGEGVDNESPVGSVFVSEPNSDDDWERVNSRSPLPVNSGSSMFLHVDRKLT